MDIMTIGGLILGFILIYAGMVQSGKLTISLFFNYHALMIVIGGTLAATMINTPWHELKNGFKALKTLIFEPKLPSPKETVSKLVNLTQKARREGISSLKDEGSDFGDGFLGRAIKMVIDGLDVEFIKNALEKEIIETKERHKETANVFRTMAVLAPMFGLIGTLIGIVGVLKNLTNPIGIGSSMAVALTTAFYGILFANLLFLPASGKLRIKSLKEILLKEIIMEGVLAIKAGWIPLMVQRHLEGYLVNGDKNLNISLDEPREVSAWRKTLKDAWEKEQVEEKVEV